MKGFDIVVTTVNDTIDNIIDTTVNTIVTGTTETNEILSVSSTLAPSISTIPKEVVKKSTLSQINNNTTSTIVPPVKITAERETITAASQTDSSTQNSLYKTTLVLSDKTQPTMKTKQEKTQTQPSILTKASTIPTERTKTQSNILAGGRTTVTERTKTQSTILAERSTTQRERTNTESNILAGATSTTQTQKTKAQSTILAGAILTEMNLTREESVPTVPSSLISDPVHDSSTSTDLALVLPLVSISLVLCLVLGLYWACRQYKGKNERRGTTHSGRGGSKEVGIRSLIEIYFELLGLILFH